MEYKFEPKLLMENDREAIFSAICPFCEGNGRRNYATSSFPESCNGCSGTGLAKIVVRKNGQSLT